MKSKTKLSVDEKTLKRMFGIAGINDITAVKPLGAGMFNAVYSGEASKKYVVKIAPVSSAKVMTYEKGMLNAELFWYDLIKKRTDIKVPDIYYTDFSHNIIDADWFIMEHLDGEHRNKAGLNEEDNLLLSAKTVAQLHCVQNDKFGYIQNGLYENWYLALVSMLENLISDAEQVGKETKRGKNLLNFAHKYKAVLEKAPCTTVNYDLWDSNIICGTDSRGQTVFSLIDPERSMWGDPVLDFLCLESFWAPINEKKKSVEYHNRFSSVKIEINKETAIRYAFAQGLMAFIQETEKFYRFSPLGQGWFFDVISSNILYRKAFEVLRNE